jgi:urea carboxylase
MRAGFLHGKVDLEIQEERFALGDYTRFLDGEADSIARFKSTQQTAFEEERQRWADSGTPSFGSEPELTVHAVPGAVESGATAVESHVHGSVWQLRTQAGAEVKRGDVLVVLESMKMEIAIEAPSDGNVLDVLVAGGQPVAPGQPLVTLRTR